MGLAQLPMSDSAIIVPIQINMIVSIGKVFDINITETMAKSIIGSLSMSFVDRTISQFALGWIPGAGNVINATTASLLTRAIGNLALSNFSDRWIEDRQKNYSWGIEYGYNEASAAYEKKLSDLAYMFKHEQDAWKNQSDRYKILLAEYEKFIEFLKENKYVEEYIKQAEKEYDELKRMSAK